MIYPKINAVLYRETFEGWIIVPRTIRDHELVFVIDGFGNTEIEEKSYKLSQGSIIYYPPGVVHRLWIDAKPYMKFYAIHFNTEQNLNLPYVNTPSDAKSIIAMAKSLYTLTRPPKIL